MQTLSVMLDCSRNAVPNERSLKNFIDVIADMGYNELQLYLEDTYEVEGEPYFGYLRGRFSAEGLKRIDKYAQSKGIELVPSIQTLAHLPRIFRWARYGELRDADDILLCDEEKTYEFLEKCFATISACFSSKKLAIGMDEAHDLGLGAHLKKHGYEPSIQIFLRHLNRVVALAEKYGFQPMMWSDMFFRVENNGEYYLKNPQISDEAVQRKPKGVDLIYWEYNIREEDVYRGMLSAHKKFGKAPRWAAASWCYTGFVPNYDYTYAALEKAFPVMRETGVEEYMLTLWGDDGMETPKMANLPVLYAFAELAKGESMQNIQRTFGEKYGISWEAFHRLNLPNDIDEPKQELDVYDPNKYMLYNDYFAGIFDSTVANGASQKYAQYAKALLEISNDQAYGYLFETAGKLCKVSAEKYALGIETRKYYRLGDREAMKSVVARYDHALEAIEEFYQAFKKQWLIENTAFGLEVHTARMGGLMQRTKDCKQFLQEWIVGARKKIDELEEDIIEFGGPRANEGQKTVVSNIYNQIFTVNYS